MAKKARIYTYTVINSAAEAFAAKVPYVVALLENDTVGRFAAFIKGYTPNMPITIGQEVEYAEQDQSGNDVYTFKEN
ncbi:MAG: OB-fold domain-containing protein [Peptococcia bacterium]